MQQASQDRLVEEVVADYMPLHPFVGHQTAERGSENEEYERRPDPASIVPAGDHRHVPNPFVGRQSAYFGGLFHNFLVTRLLDRSSVRALVFLLVPVIECDGFESTVVLIPVIQDLQIAAIVDEFLHRFLNRVSKLGALL